MSREEIQLLPGETLCDLERNGLLLIQKEKGFRFGMDAVLLSGFAAVRPGECAADLGTGSGIIPVLLSAKTKAEQLYGIEVQPEMADMAARSVVLNALSDRVSILEGDLRELLPQGSRCFRRLGGTGKVEKGAADDAGTGADTDGGEPSAEPFTFFTFPLHACDVVTSNPPYMKAEHGLKNPDSSKALSRHEVLCSLDDVCYAAERLLRSGGRFYMVHRPQRLAELLSTLNGRRLSPKRIRFVHPFADREANMVLIEAVRDGGEGCRIEQPLIIFETEGVYTAEIRESYGF